jgi:hypothetical protein
VLGFGIWVLGFGIVPKAQVNMPDPSLIHGRAIPAPELAVGTVTVRVVRENIGNNISGQQVVLTVGGQTRTATTDAQGRAEFTGLPPGAQVSAAATVDGERLTSQAFAVPASGGLRVILVAGLQNAAARRKQEEAAAQAAPPVKGTVVIGSNSRVMLEFNDDALSVFYILEVLNNARARVDIGGPLIIDLPTGAGGAAIMEGSSPNATVSGDRVTVLGPFAPGATSVQVAYRMNLDRPELTLEQTWPVAMEQVTVGVQKLGGLSVTSPQFTGTRDVESDNGMPFVIGEGGSLPAGTPLTIQLANLPAHSRTPRFVALGLAGAVILVGIWLTVSAGSRQDDVRRTLLQRRDALLAELAALERRHGRGAPSLAAEASAKAAGPADAKYVARRERIVSELERIYGELDEASPGPQGGGEGIAA